MGSYLDYLAILIGAIPAIVLMQLWCQTKLPDDYDDEELLGA